MKKLLLYLVILLIAPLAHATTYYVDNCVTVGSDSNNGTSTATPWLTIAHVNAQTFNPEDSILFQGGCTWRESLLPPRSGSSGSPITFGSYGSGAQPIIDGADLTTGWTAAPAIPVLQDSFGTANAGGSLAIGATSKTWSAGAFTPTANYTSVQFSVRLHINTGAPFTHPVTAYIYTSSAGVPGSLLATASSTIQPTLTSTWTVYTFPFSGISLTSRTQYYLVLQTTLDNSNFGSWSTASGASRILGYTSSNGTTWAAYASGYQPYILTYIAGTAPVNVYQATVSTQPNQVFFDGTLGTLETSIAALTANDEWYWASGTLYIYSSTAPSGHTIEASSRSYPVSWNGKNYVTVQGLHLTKANLNDVCMANAACSTSTSILGAVLSGNLIDYGYGTGVISRGATTSALIKANEVTANNPTNEGGAGIGVGGIDLDGGDAAGAVVVEDNYVHNNYTGGIECDQFDSYCTVAYNIVTGETGTTGTGITTDNHNYALIEYNLIYGNSSYCMFLYSATSATVTGIQVFGNVCYGNTKGGLVTDGTQTAFSIENNIFDSDGTVYQELSLGAGGALSGTGLTINNNDYRNTSMSHPWSLGVGYYNTLSYWQGTGYDANSSNANPLFTNPSSNIFTLQFGSPAKGTGANLGSKYARGLLPNSAWPSGVLTGTQASRWNMGAYLSTTYVPQVGAFAVGP
jgi:hypothetical protein